MFRVASWNVNSINARLERALAFLERAKPDALCLQELKGPDEKFPMEAIEKAGYHAAIFGQKSYNGVAVLSKTKPTNVVQGLQDKVDDDSSRLIGVTVKGVRVISAYCPNGQEVGAKAYDFKLKWFKRLRKYLEKHHKPSEKIILAGDFNVAPDDRDVYDPKKWEGKIHFSEPEKKALIEVCDFGLVDTFRIHHEEGGFYSWWDYRQLGFPKNRGLRLDFIFASSPLAKKCKAASIDRDERKGSKPSDHAPTLADFDL